MVAPNQNQPSFHRPAGEPVARQREGRRSGEGGRFRLCAEVHAGYRSHDAVRDTRLRGARDPHAQVSAPFFLSFSFAPFLAVFLEGFALSRHAVVVVTRVPLCPIGVYAQVFSTTIIH